MGRKLEKFKHAFKKKSANDKRFELDVSQAELEIDLLAGDFETSKLALDGKKADFYTVRSQSAGS